MATQTERPAQYKQSSRKGKKAWRKNIDISDIEKSIQKRNDEEITHGSKDLTSLANKDLFQVDTEGDEQLKRKLIKRKQIKKNLKSAEILESIQSRSKVPALSHPKRGLKEQQKKEKIQGVSKKEVRRLMALAGRIDGESKLKNAVSKRGLVRAGANTDLWGAEEEVKTPSGIKMSVKTGQEIPEELKKLSTTGWSKATVAPNTITRSPVMVKSIDQSPHAGKSYNPSNSSWSQLIDTEYEGEKAREETRLQMEAYKARISDLMQSLDDEEEEEDSDDDEKSDKDEELDAQENAEIKLSLNKPVVNKKKTKYQRNKQKRHNDKLELHSELKQLKSQLRQLEQFAELQKSVEEAEAARTERTSQKVTKPAKGSKKHKLGTKHSVIDDGLEVKFSDELSDSLRKLRPEGNLLYDTVRKLQGSGKIEARVPVRKGRRYTPKITEKWTYKDLK
ncbi:LAME_0F12772g1_1 [Lachancea meyersii CBS 8951]|uniref:Ribosome biogenesis protein NOP53 n=1 Tax=Lachancea meyersii CBS 8951 TaxID=1266667 RepID=A0A1G4JX34_9SACH|nr:LAME_0F12772g1_1 [Lachancea meyersii CBS 8951]